MTFWSTLSMLKEMCSSSTFPASILEKSRMSLMMLSMVFDEKTDASTRAKATKVLNSPAKSPENVIFDQQLLGAWLNFANGSVKLATPVDTDGNGSKDSTFGAAVFTAESVRINPASSSAQIKAQKDIIERVALQSGN